MTLFLGLPPRLNRGRHARGVITRTKRSQTIIYLAFIFCTFLRQWNYLILTRADIHKETRLTAILQ